MEAVRKFFERDELAKELGIELVEVSKGRALARMGVERRHLNGVGTAHGGALFSLADFAFAVACNSGGQVSVAANASISFVAPAFEGELLTAEAEEAAPHAKLAPYVIRIRNERGEIVAVMQGLAYRKRETLEQFVAQLEKK